MIITYCMIVQNQDHELRYDHTSVDDKKTTQLYFLCFRKSRVLMLAVLSNYTYRMGE